MKLYLWLLVAVCYLVQNIIYLKSKFLSTTVKLKGEVNEEAFVDKLVKRLKGYGGLTVPFELDTEVEAEAYKSSSIVKKVMNTPLRSSFSISVERGVLTNLRSELFY